MTCRQNRRTGAALCFVVIFLSGVSLAQSQPGVLVPQNIAIGEQASGSIVLNAADWQNVTGVRVVPFQLPKASSATAQALSNYLVETNLGQSFPANAAFPFKVAEHLTLRVKPVGPGAQPITIDIPFSPAAITPPQGFTTSPIAMPGLMQTVRGPFQGDASQASVTLNNAQAPILAESQSSLFYLVPENTPAGASRCPGQR